VFFFLVYPRMWITRIDGVNSGGFIDK
jgi:hypothetical protein